MKRIAIGAVSGLAVWFASAMAAEAQQITPTGPLAVYASDTSEVYTATITTNYSFTFYLQVFVNGTQVYGGQWYIVNSGPSYNFQSPVLSTASWGLYAGAAIDFRGTVQLGLTHRVTNDYNLTVQQGITMAPAAPSASMLAQALPSRKQESELALALEDRRNA